MKKGDKVVCIKESGSGRFVLNERVEISHVESHGGLSDIFFIRWFPFRSEDFLEHFMPLEDWREKQLEQIICILE
jgi:hypothetical protein